jgi:hypothetical protein
LLRAAAACAATAQGAAGDAHPTGAAAAAADTGATGEPAAAAAAQQLRSSSHTEPLPPGRASPAAATPPTGAPSPSGGVAAALDGVAATPALTAAQAAMRPPRVSSLGEGGGVAGLPGTGFGGGPLEGGAHFTGGHHDESRRGSGHAALLPSAASTPRPLLPHEHPLMRRGPNLPRTGVPGYAPMSPTASNATGVGLCVRVHMRAACCHMV